MKAIVDQDACTACGLCIDLCPEVFQEAPDGNAVAIEDDVPPELEEAARDAADQCPVEAISIEE
ncbi:MAG: ferredoxin [Thermoguttaceae bacterium]|jgi:ferredoxin|nr:ferredoxin [Thermoguttaceae bacterium]